MAVMTSKLVVKIEDEDDDVVTGVVSPIGFRDKDDTVAWVEGTHISNGVWEFDVPTGLNSGLKIGVQTAAGVFTEDVNLSGDQSTESQGGLPLVPMVPIEI